MVPLERAEESGAPLLPRAQMAAVAPGRLRAILRANTALRDQLQARLAHWHVAQTLGDVFVTVVRDCAGERGEGRGRECFLILFSTASAWGTQYRHPLP